MKDLATYIRAGFAALYAVTHEEERIAGEIKAMAKTLGYTYWTWTCTEGLKNHDENKVFDKTAEPLAALTAFVATEMKGKVRHGTTVGNKSIVLMLDFHLFLKTVNPVVVRRLKEAIIAGRSTNRHLIIMGCQLHLPPELEKEVTVVEFPLPTREELEVVANQIAKHAKLEVNGSRDKILDAGSGLTTQEFADASSFAVIETKEMSPAVISRIKAETIKKNGILEVVQPGVTFDDLGGLHSLKSWITKRKHAFTAKAREYGLPIPKGVCLYGVQGAGKSYATRAIASELDCPLLRLDAGKLFGSLVGSSEANVRSVIAQVEAFGKAVLQLDELDKGFAGMTGGHDGDSGTTRRVVGTFLTWMQDKTSPVFIVATANDLTRLPPELLRKGRWDELFFIDLPTMDERVEIWRIQIRRRGRKPETFDLEALAEVTNKWTGAEIESLFAEAMYAAFDSGTEPTTDLLVSLSKNTVPLSSTMGEAIETLRDWSRGRCRAASEQVVEPVFVDTSRKLG